jgi:antitoxin (DNA-binding transcriptional repressor) of toxin-antitoxin stability system
MKRAMRAPGDRSGVAARFVAAGAKRRRVRGGVTATAARHISATDAARSFSDVLNRVQYRGETVVVERGGTPVCEMAPAKPVRFMLSDLAALLRSVPKPDPAYWDTLEEILNSQSPVQSPPWGR